MDLHHLGSSGSGSGSVNYNVDSNSSTSSRTGSITAAGSAFTVTQSGLSSGGEISASASPNPVDIGLPSTITVSVTDGSGAPPAPGTTVTFSTSDQGYFSGNNSSSAGSPSSTVTDSNGETWIWFTSEVPGTANITVTALEQSALVPIEFVDPTPGMQVQTTVGFSHGTSSYSVYEIGAVVTDAAGDPVANQDVTFEFSPPSVGYWQGFNSCDTGPGGACNVDLVVTTAGEIAITANAGASSGATTFFAYIGDDPADWTMQWTWTPVSNTDTVAVYDCHVLIQYQGANLDPGDDVQFAANHGTFTWAEDEVVNSGYVENRYTLTKAEADSGNEIFTLNLPAYGTELTYVTNLPVGPPPPLAPFRTTSLVGSNQDDEAFSVAFSDDGRFAARTNIDAVVIYNLSDLSVVRTVDPNYDDINAIDFSPDGNKIVAGDIDGNVFIITVATGDYSTTNVSDGNRGIRNLHWYGANAIAVAVEGNTSESYLPRIVMMNGSGGVTQPPITFSGVPADEDLHRIVCNETAGLCATMRGWSNVEWIVFTTTGSVLSGVAKIIPTTIQPLPWRSAKVATGFSLAGIITMALPGRGSFQSADRLSVELPTR